MFKVFKVVPPGSGQLAGGENLKKTLKMVVPPAGQLAGAGGGGTLKTLNGGATTISEFSKVVPPVHGPGAQL